MKKKIFAIVMMLLMLCSCSIGKREVYLYGEDHDIKPIYNEELNILRDYYKKGGRNYFLEYPHYCAQYFNLWMKSDNDEYLNKMFDFFKEYGNYDYDYTIEFYKTIKKEMNDIKFYGVDVGHAYDRIGKDYLKLAKEKGDKKDIELTERAIEQGKNFYGKEKVDHLKASEYRDKMMAENFMDTYNRTKGDVIGFFGLAHINGVGYVNDYMTKIIQDKIKNLHTVNLLKSKNLKPISTEKITYNGREFEADYYGIISHKYSTYPHEKLYRIKDKEYFKDFTTIGYNQSFPYNFSFEKGDIILTRQYNDKDQEDVVVRVRSDGTEKLFLVDYIQPK